MRIPKTIRVLLIEDNRLLRDGIAAILAEQPDFEVVAAVGRADEALPQARKTKAQVVLVDAGLGDHDSHRLVARVKQAEPEAKVIVMDLFPLPEDVFDFVKAGASGFILKDATVDDFVRTIRAVAGGADILPPTLTGTLFSHIAQQAVSDGTADLIDAVRLTRREREVFHLIADGLSNKEISQRLHVATNTVKGHVHNILEKLALHTRLQIATLARTSDSSVQSA